MAVIDQCIGEKFAIYNADCMDVMQSMPAGCVHLSIYSPPFGGLYHYSSNERDLSNCDDYDGFFEHYAHVVRELARITMPGRITAVHCMDVPRGEHRHRLADRLPWRHHPLARARGLALHRPANDLEGAARRAPTHNAEEPRARLPRGRLDRLRRCLWRSTADFPHVLAQNPVPVKHPQGLLDYAGERMPPNDVLPYRGWTGNQIENRFSHWIWRQYADCMWDDVRMNRTLPFREARDSEDEKHVHPLQLDVIDRCVELFSNPGETVFTPFMGVGSEVYSPVILGRRGVGVELKPSYYRQALKNVQMAAAGRKDIETSEPLFVDADES